MLNQQKPPRWRKVHIGVVLVLTFGYMIIATAIGSNPCYEHAKDVYCFYSKGIHTPVSGTIYYLNYISFWGVTLLIISLIIHLPYITKGEKVRQGIRFTKRLFLVFSILNILAFLIMAWSKGGIPSEVIDDRYYLSMMGKTTEVEPSTYGLLMVYMWINIGIFLLFLWIRKWPVEDAQPDRPEK